MFTLPAWAQMMVGPVSVPSKLRRRSCSSSLFIGTKTVLKRPSEESPWAQASMGEQRMHRSPTLHERRDVLADRGPHLETVSRATAH